MLDLLLARCSLVGAARSSVAYCRANGLDWPSTEAACGGLFLAAIKPQPRRRFDFSSAGVEAAVIEVFDDDAETAVDLVAWPVERPDVVLTALGCAAVLGSWNALDPATFAFGLPLQLHRTPLAWLQTDCRGAVLLDRARGIRWLRDIDGPFAAEDDAHAAEIRDALVAGLRLDRLHVPRMVEEAA